MNTFTSTTDKAAISEKPTKTHEGDTSLTSVSTKVTSDNADSMHLANSIQADILKPSTAAAMKLYGTLELYDANTPQVVPELQPLTDSPTPAQRKPKDEVQQHADAPNQTNQDLPKFDIGDNSNTHSAGTTTKPKPDSQNTKDQTSAALKPQADNARGIGNALYDGASDFLSSIGKGFTVTGHSLYKWVSQTDDAGLTKPPDNPMTIDDLVAQRHKDDAKQNIGNLTDLTEKGIRQGGLSDCHFVSAMEDIRNQPGGKDQLMNMLHHPDDAKWITDRKDGDRKHEDPNGHYDKYLVKFPGYEIPVDWSEVHKDDGAFDNTAMNISTLNPAKDHLPDGESSRYPAILEAAAGKIFQQQAWGSADRNGHYSDNDPSQNMNYSPDGAKLSQQLLTGAASTMVDLDGKGPPANMTSEKLQEMIANGSLVTVRQTSGPDAHQLSVIDIKKDEFGRTCFLVKNPQAEHKASQDLFGKDFNPDFPIDKDGTHAVMIPEDQFWKQFTSISYTPENPAK